MTAELEQKLNWLQDSHAQLAEKLDNQDKSIREMASAVTELATSVRIHFEQSAKEDAKWANVFGRINALELVTARLSVSNTILGFISGAFVVGVIGAFIKLYPGAA